MNFTNFKFHVSSKIINASSGTFDAYVRQNGTGYFSYKNNQIIITYEGRWSYLFNGATGRGDTLEQAMVDQENNYKQMINNIQKLTNP